MWSDGMMAPPGCQHTTASGHATKQANNGKDVQCRVHLHGKKACRFVTANTECPGPTVAWVSTPTAEFYLPVYYICRWTIAN